MSADRITTRAVRALASLCLMWGSLSAVGAAAEPLVYPLDVAVAPDGTVYIADLKLPGIWSYRDGQLNKFFEGSPRFRTPLNAVRCVRVGDDGTVYAGDSATREIYKFVDGQPQPLTNGRIGIPITMLLDGERIVVSDLETQRIWSVPLAGGEPTEVAVIAGVRGLAFGEGGDLYCVTTLEDPVRRITQSGELDVVIPGRPFQLTHHAVTVGNELYVADNYAVTIWKVPLTKDAQPNAFASGVPLVRPVGLCRYGDGFLVADPHARDVFVLNAEGELRSLFAK